MKSSYETRSAMERGVQRALREDGNGNGKMISSNCTAPAGRGIQTALIDASECSNSSRTATPTRVEKGQIKGELSYRKIINLNFSMLPPSRCSKRRIST
jgi:hypothetical protein